MKVNSNFLKKYNTTGPRYTSYPPATFFNDKSFLEEDLFLGIKSSSEAINTNRIPKAYIGSTIVPHEADLIRNGKVKRIVKDEYFNTFKLLYKKYFFNFSIINKHIKYIIIDQVILFT